MIKKSSNYPTPRFLVSGFDNGKKSLKSRFQSIFEDDKKKRGLMFVIVIVIIALLAGSLLFFGNGNVEQINDSLTVYIRDINTHFPLHFQEELPTSPKTEGYFTSYLINDFKEAYPDVNLNVVNLSQLNEEQFYDKISTELIAGKGPDVIIGTEEFMKYRDVKKLIRSGAFAELDSFIEDDTQKTFSPENCFNNIMEFGRYKGRTYVIPVNFEFPLLYSTHQALSENNIDINTCSKDYMGFTSEVDKLIKKLEEPNNQYIFYDSSNTTFFTNLVYQPELYDKDTLKSFAEKYKPIYQYTTNKPLDYSLELAFYEKNIIFAGYQPEMFFDDQPVRQLTEDFIRMRALDEDPVMITLNQLNGDFPANVTVFAGVNANSPNQQNAYNYIKMLAGGYNGYYTDKKMLTTNKIALTVALSSALTGSYEWDVPKMDLTFKYPTYTKKDVSSMIKFIESIDVAYCKNPMTYEVEAILKEYYIGNTSLDECIKQVDEKMTIYKSE